MAIENGFFLVYRGWRQHRFFRNEPFSRGDAFLWLIEKAAYQPTTIFVGNVRVALKPGQLCVSLRYMANAFGWSTKKVTAFLNSAQSEEILVTAKETGQTLITICNYTKYQSRGNSEETPKETQKKQQGNAEETKYKENKEDIYNNPQSKPIDHHARENENSAGFDTDLELKILDVIHAAGMPSIPKDTNLLAVWLKKGATMEDHILPVVRRTSERLLRDTGRAPFTFKIFHDDIAQAVAKDRAAEYARAASDQQIASMNERWEEGQQRVRDREAEMKPVYDRMTPEDWATPLIERAHIYRRIKAEIAAEQSSAGETLQ